MSEIYPLCATNVSRYYGSFQALAPFDLTMMPGQVVALTGPNGSGKTTLLNCLSGLLQPSTGKISIAGYDLHADERDARRHLAYVPDVPRFYTELTAWEHLQFIAMAHNAHEGFPERAETLLRDFGLWEARNIYPHNYSRGMRLKLGIVMALVRPFKVLLLDEPTSALDPEGTELLLNRLRALQSLGVGVLFSTHALDITPSVADTCLVMRNGQLESA